MLQLLDDEQVPTTSRLMTDLRTPVLVEAVLEQITDAVIVYDLEQRSSSPTARAEKLVGAVDGELLHQHCHNVFKVRRM